MKRIFRFVVSFLLICVILVNCSPIRAQATGAEAIFFSSVVVNPSIAVTAVLFGLGVMAVATATAAFTKLVDEITVDMVDKGLISSQGVDMYRADADGAATYLVNQELVEAVRDYLWENEVLTADGTVPDGYVAYGDYIFPAFSSSRDYSWLYVKGDYLCYATSSYIPKSSVFNNYTWFYSTGSTKTMYKYLLIDGAWKSDGSAIFSDSYGGTSYDLLIWSNFDFYDYATGELISAAGSFDDFTTDIVGVSDGLAAGTIAGQDKTFAEGYSEWASGAKSLPTLWDGVQTDAESAYIALGMGLTQEETMAMTQAAVQSGVGTYEGTGTTADTITASGLKGWLDTLRLSMVAGFSDVITGIKDFFTPSGKVEAYALDLKLLFPFCIPFDLFNLLKVLQADPVAPHFEFELDFGSLGKFPVSVDFSEWNDLASLLRMLEMGLFIVGLAVGTRKLMGD